MLSIIKSRCIVEPSSGCWVWQGQRYPKGYGKASVSGKRLRAHRLAWALANGPIPDGMFVCHHCDNPPCVNPAHLFLGTAAENMNDAARKGRLGRRRLVSGADVCAIKEALAAGATVRAITQKLGFGRRAIRAVARTLVVDGVRPSVHYRKLTADTVRQIRARAGERAVCLASEFGVTHDSIRNVLNRKTWKQFA